MTQILSMKPVIPLTVAELIERLSKLNPEAPVYMNSPSEPLEVADVRYYKATSPVNGHYVILDFINE